MKTYLSTRLLLKQKVETPDGKNNSEQTLHSCWVFNKRHLFQRGLDQRSSMSGLILGARSTTNNRQRP
jgi:hypothetical protein